MAKDKQLPRELLDAREEAQRFLDRVMEVEKRYVDDEYFRQYIGIVGFKEMARMKRASHDLSDALVKLRRPYS